MHALLTSVLTTLPGSEPADATATLQEILPPILMVAGVVLLGFLILSSVRRKIAGRQADTPTARERIEAVKVRTGRRDDADAHMARLYDTAKQLAGQLDAKAERLEQLLEQADARLAALEGATGGTTTGAAPPPPAEPDPVTRTVYALADEGRSTVEIARELDEGVGKVELILALRGSQQMG